MNKSLLAVVHAAANDPIPPAEVSVTTTQKETPMPNLNTPPAGATAAAVTTVADLSAAFPDLCAAIRNEGLTAGATAERTRVLGIAALADSSNGALIAEMQADGKTTVEGAAFRILGAQQEARGQQLRAIADVETVTGAVKPAPTGAAAAPGAAAPAKASTPDGWKAEWAASADLQSEFDSAESFVAYQQGVASGRIKRLQSRSA